MTRKKLLLMTVLTTTAALGAGGFYYLENAPYYSDHYRHTKQTEVTLHILSCSLQSYQLDYGSPPEGGNATILSQLLGGNSHKTAYISEPKAYNASDWPPKFATDPERRIVDGWGTPVRFRFSDSIRVQSAGEDRKFDTPDDLFESTPNR